MLGAGDVEDFAGAFVVAGNAGADREVCTASDEQLEGVRSVTPGQAPTALRWLPRRCSQQRRDHRLSRRRPRTQGIVGESSFLPFPASMPPRLRGRNDTADLYSIFDLCQSNGGMEPVSNRNYRTSVADAVEPATCHNTAIRTQTA